MTFELPSLENVGLIILTTKKIINFPVSIANPFSFNAIASLMYKTKGKLSSIRDDFLKGKFLY